MSADIKDVLRRIKKCLALSSSPNAYEAATALAMAQKLMAAHNVSQAALLDAELEESTIESTALNKIPACELQLSHGLDRIFGCTGYVRSGWCDWQNRKNHKLASFVYIGANGSAETASYAHEVVRRAVLKAKQEYMKTLPDWYDRTMKRAASNSFCEAFVEAAFKSVTTLKPSEEISNALTLRLKEKLGIAPKSVKYQQHEFFEEAFEAGTEAGAAFKIHAGVGASGSQLKLSSTPSP